jgi:hypothetical protein
MYKDRDIFGNETIAQLNYIKISSEQEFLISSESMFLNLGAHTAKAPSPNVVVFVDGKFV